MFADMDSEAKVWAILAAILAVFVVVLLVSLLSAWKESDTADDNRRAAEKHSIEETRRANAAEAELVELAPLRLTVRDDPRAPDKTLVLSVSGAILGDPT